MGNWQEGPEPHLWCLGGGIGYAMFLDLRIRGRRCGSSGGGNGALHFLKKSAEKMDHRWNGGRLLWRL